MNNTSLIKLIDVLPSITTDFCCSFAPMRTKEMLNQTQSRVIIFIGKHPSISIKELSEKFNIDLGALSRLVNGLVHDGYISKQKSKVDKRQSILDLTEEGQNIFKQLEKQFSVHFEKIIDSLTDVEKEEFENSLMILKKIHLKLKGANHGTTI